MLPHVARSCGVHHGDIADELLVDVMEFADTLVGGIDQRCIRREWGSDDRIHYLWNLACWRGINGLTVSGQDSLHALKFGPLEFFARKSNHQIP